MGVVLHECDVWPHHHQVDLSDPLTLDYPQWATGDELAVATPSSVAVATHADFEGGEVKLEVWSGPAEPLPALIWEGDITLAGDEAVVGNTEGNDLHPVTLGSGRHHVRVFGDVSPRPSRIAFVVTDVARNP